MIGGIGTYVYANADPVGFTDSLGLAIDCDEEDDCFDKCIEMYYGRDNYDLAVAVSPFSLAAVALNAATEAVTDALSRKANRNLNRGTLAKGTVKDGVRQMRTLGQFGRFNAAAGIASAGAAGFVGGAWAYCQIECL